ARRRGFAGRADCRPQGGPKPVQPYTVSISWPGPWGNVHAPPNAPTGAATISANALATARERQSLGPAPVKNLPPKRSKDKILAASGLRQKTRAHTLETTLKGSRFSRCVKDKLTL